MAVLGHLTQTLEQAAHFGSGSAFQCEAENGLGGGVRTRPPWEARCPSGLTGKAPRQPQRAPVRRAVAGAGKSRDVHGERFRQEMPDESGKMSLSAPAHEARHSARRHDSWVSCPGLLTTRSRSGSPSTWRYERQVVVLLHRSQRRCSCAPQVGRTVTARKSMDESETGSGHDRTPRMKWPAPRSPHPDHWADKKLALTPLVY